MTTDAPSTGGPLAAAWRWSMRRSPIMGLVRAIGDRIRRHRHAAALIADAELSDPVRERIGAIVKRTRLLASEQADVARELVAHARDAAADRKAEAQILGALGDPAPVGRLIRRAVKRKRPLPYQLRRWAFRALLASLALAVGFYIVLLIRFNTGSPSVTTNHYARLNAPIHALPDSDKAWPIYRDVLNEWIALSEHLRETSRVDPDDTDPQRRHPGVDSIPDPPRDHPDYDATAAAVRSFRPSLDRAVEASSRPALGVLLSDRSRRVDIEGTDRWYLETVEPAADPTDQQSMTQTLLPQLAESRTIARVLAFDIRLALDERDADRVLADTRALLGLARQLRGQPSLISSLVAIAVHELAMRRIAIVIHEAPDLLSKAQLTELSHDIAAHADTTLDLDLEGERAMFQDLLQRSFTDDGRGRGRLTPEGARLLTQLADPPMDFGAVPHDQRPWILRSASALAMPVMGAAVADRARQTRMHDEMLSIAERTLSAGPDALPTLFAPAQERIAELERDRAAWYPLSAVYPAIGHCISSVFRARASADATLALLAASAFRADQGRWPDTLGELAPRYLPEIPPDPFDPGARLRYRLDADTPRLWYAGADADDDSGQAPGAGPRNSRLLPVSSLDRRINPDAEAQDGDWVLFPPVD